MAQVMGSTWHGGKLFLCEDGSWVPESQFATEFAIPEAERRVRIINTNNRFLDHEDQMQAVVVESR